MKYQRKMSDEKVLDLLKRGIYQVDPSTGVLTRNGRIITPYIDKYGYYWVRLYHGGERRGIALGRLVWMSAAGRCLPSMFEVHHRDTNKSNNSWANLFALFRRDHQKLAGLGLVPSDDPPF